MTEEDLRGMFSLYGDLISVKCLASKGCAFVQYTSTAAAKAAMTMLQDQVLPISHSFAFHSNWIILILLQTVSAFSAYERCSRNLSGCFSAHECMPASLYVQYVCKLPSACGSPPAKFLLKLLSAVNSRSNVSFCAPGCCWIPHPHKLVRSQKPA